MFQKIFAIILLVSFFPLAILNEVTTGLCSCAVMPKDDLLPILEHSLQYNVTCDQEGADICKQLCIALSQSAKERAPAMICKKLDDTVTDFMVELYSKTCNGVKWEPTGLVNLGPICCEKGKPTICFQSKYPFYESY